MSSNIKFREHGIVRTCTKSYSSYRAYREYLKKDFKNRCCYCNMHDKTITTPFQIDHYIPIAEFKKNVKYKYLETDYNNLMYACPK